MIVKLTTRSGTAAVSVMVPNSLGPAELLLHYGTKAQKDHYLPRLARGVAYAQAGLVEAAVAELEELRRQNPHSPIARDLLRSLRRTAQRRGIH